MKRQEKVMKNYRYQENYFRNTVKVNGKLQKKRRNKKFTREELEEA